MEVKEAISKVLELGKDGKEHLIVLDSKGEVVVEKQGTENNVSMEGELDIVKAGGTVVHNHPFPVSLSGPDIWLAGRMHCDIWAVIDNGSRYWSSGVDGASGEPLMEVIYTNLEENLCNLVTAGLYRHGMSSKEINLIGEHVKNCILASKGVHQYKFDLKGEAYSLAQRVQASGLSTRIAGIDYVGPTL